MKTILFDIESDGLLDTITTIHCISIKINNSPTEVYTSRPIKGSKGNLEEAVEILKSADRLVMHNGVKFDLPAIHKILGVNLWDTQAEIYDTLLSSKLAYPNLLIIDSNNKKLGKLKGSHSLKAWGIRLRNLKGAFGNEEEETWEKLTEEMVEYCRQDTEVTYSLYQKLLSKDIPKEAMWLETNFARIIQRQEAYGVLFDVEKAKELHVELIREKEEALKELHKVFKPIKVWTPHPYPSKPYKKDGSKSHVLINQELKGCHYNSEGEWGYWEEIELNPNSGKQLVLFIEHYFGKQEWYMTEKGNPKTGADFIYEMFQDKEWAYPLLHYLILDKLHTQLVSGSNSWLNKVSSDSRIYGQVDTLGAVSRRCTHKNPNLAQVPSVKKSGKIFPKLRDLKLRLGQKSRSLFIVPKGKKIVGCDASGLELRTLSHYMAKYDGGKYGRIVDKGDSKKGTDVHTLNQKSAGLPTRDDAKTFIYAFLYGAGVAKLGSITGGGAKEGSKLKKKFLKKLPALEKLIQAVQKAVKERGYLKALDGNKFFIRAEHSALNTLLQGCGALVMKYYLIFLDENLEKYKGRYEFVLNIHDEVQIEVDEEIAEEVAKIAESTFNDVTDYLDFRVPLRGEAKIGNSWKETH